MRRVILTRHAVRLGFRQIKGLSKDRMNSFVGRRGTGYSSVRDLWLRSGLDVDEIEKIAQADAFRSIGLDRREALWEVRALGSKNAVEKLPLFDRPAMYLREMEPQMHLPEMQPGEHVVHDYRTLGLSLKAHPVAFLRQRLDSAGVTPNIRLSAIQDGTRVTVAGVVLVRQRPGKGNAIFLTLEDEETVANIIIWPRVFDRFRPIVMAARFIRVTGRLQSESGVIHIVAEKFEDLSSWLALLLETQPPPPARTDGMKAGRPDRNPRSGSGSLPLTPDMDTLAREASRTMPKGRNFQ
jgi:error-prone DNA polymerase